MVPNIDFVWLWPASLKPIWLIDLDRHFLYVWVTTTRAPLSRQTVASIPVHTWCGERAAVTTGVGRAPSARGQRPDSPRSGEHGQYSADTGFRTALPNMIVSWCSLRSRASLRWLPHTRETRTTNLLRLGVFRSQATSATYCASSISETEQLAASSCAVSKLILSAEANHGIRTCLMLPQVLPAGRPLEGLSLAPSVRIVLGLALAYRGRC